MCDQYNSRTLTAEEQIIATEIFRLLAKDAEVVIRQAMAEKLKHNSRLPEDVAFMMANDVLQVALPVLQFSPVLSEEDLLMIVRGTKDLAKLLAVTKRDVVSPAVSKEIVAKKQPVLSESLIRNRGAFVAAEDMQMVVEQFSHVDSLMTALVERQELPPVIVEKLMAVVNTALKDALIKKHVPHTHAVQEVAEETHAETTLLHASQPANPIQKEELIEHLYRTQKLNSSMVIRAICLGDLEFFVSSMVKLTGWKKHRIEDALQANDITAMRRMYRAGGLPESIQDATIAVLVFVLDELRNGHKPDMMNFAGRIIERVVAAGYDRSVSGMSYLLSLIGKKPSIATEH
jgi:uncharacterized protein (DUF2336 family)